MNIPLLSSLWNQLLEGLGALSRLPLTGNLSYELFHLGEMPSFWKQINDEGKAHRSC